MDSSSRESKAGGVVASLDDTVVGIAGALLGALASVAAPLVTVRPNRVLSGVPETAYGYLGASGLAIVVSWVVAALLLAIAARPRVKRGVARALPVLSGILAQMVVVGGMFAASASLGSSGTGTGDLTRVSLAWGFWVQVLAAYLVAFGASRASGATWERVMVSVSGIAVASVLLVAGGFDGLSVMVEYSNASGAFWGSVAQHLGYTVGTTTVALLLGVALGVWSAKNAAVESAVFGVLNVAQVMPALAFVGLLIVPMGWLGRNVPAAAAVGVSGIGWAPVFVVLLFYALYPITRNTHSAIRTLDSGVIDAAKGVGMGPWQRVWRVELPLAFPVVLAGVRIALVQTAAGAIIAALVGGGGLGRVVFYGVEQTASDLVLLGVVPIVGLALGFDTALRWSGGALERVGGLAAAETEGAVA